MNATHSLIQSSAQMHDVAAVAVKFITDLVNDGFALSPAAKVRAQEFLAKNVPKVEAACDAIAKIAADVAVATIKAMPAVVPPKVEPKHADVPVAVPDMPLETPAKAPKGSVAQAP